MTTKTIGKYALYSFFILASGWYFWETYDAHKERDALANIEENSRARLYWDDEADKSQVYAFATLGIGVVGILLLLNSDQSVRKYETEEERNSQAHLRQ
jgi:hypothetical protein